MQSGSVRAYDCRRNELLWTVSDCHEGGVTGLTFSTADGGSFLACGPDAQVSVISVAKGAVGSRFKAGSRGLSAIAATPDGSRVLAASSSVAVYERDGTRRSKFTGHPAPVKAAAVTPDGSFAVTAASGELSASVWDLSKRKGSSSCTLPLPDPASHLAISERTAEGFLCAALVQSGQLIVFRVTAGSDAVQVTAPLCFTAPILAYPSPWLGPPTARHLPHSRAF